MCDCVLSLVEDVRRAAHCLSAQYCFIYMADNGVSIVCPFQAPVDSSGRGVDNICPKTDGQKHREDHRTDSQTRQDQMKDTRQVTLHTFAYGCDHIDLVWR